MAFNRNKSLTKAQKLLQKGKIADAIKEYQEVVDNDPADVRTLLKIGDLQAKLGNIEGANDTYRKVGEHYAKDGFFLKAVAVFKQILKLDPGLISIYLRLAELYQQLGLNSEAMKQYQVVVRHYENKGLKKESLDILRKMAELDPENTSSKIKLAELYAREGHKEAAAEQFKTVANDLRKKSNFQDLARVFEKMDVLGMADSTVKVEQAEMYLRTAEPKKALAELQVLFQQDPKHAPTLELLARSFLDLQQPEKAKSVYKELVAILDAKGMLEERDRIMSKLKALGFSGPISSRSVSSPVSAASHSFASESTSGSVPVVAQDTNKMLGEVEVLLQYGLVDKVCETLARVVVAEPDNEAARKKLISVYHEKKDSNALGEILGQALKTAEARQQREVADALRLELSSLGIEEAESVSAVEAPILSDADIDESVELEIVDDEIPAPAEKAATNEVAETPIQLEDEFERPAEESSVESFDLESASLVEDEQPGDKTVFEPKSEALESPPDISAGDVDAAIQFDLAEESFDIAAESVDAAESIEAPTVDLGADEAVDFELEVEPADEEEKEPAVSEETRQFHRSEEDEGDLYQTDMEEAAYFVQQGLLDEAMELYESILGQDSTYAPAQERLAELKGVKPVRPAVRPDTGEPERRKEARAPKVPVEEVSKSKPKATIRVLSEQSKVASPTEVFFDLSSELQDEISDLEEALEKKRPTDDEEYLSPEEVISEFKKGVARTVAKDDYQTHYNLGIAYKEMGLLDEAIHEFKVAQKDPKMAVHCASMIGMSLVGKRDFPAAIENYRRALAQISPQTIEALGLNYELAEAFIASGNLVEAYKLFARIRDVDPAFRDVRRRAKELEADLGSAAPPPSAPEKPVEAISREEKPAAKKEKEDQVKIRAKKTKISYI